MKDPYEKELEEFDKKFLDTMYKDDGYSEERATLKSFIRANFIPKSFVREVLANRKLMESAFAPFLGEKDIWESGAMRDLIMGDGKWELSAQRGRDIHPGIFIEAICPHGVGHHKGVHGCDGCCTNVPRDIWDKVTTD